MEEPAKSEAGKSQKRKQPRPKKKHVQKRPIMHPPIPSPYAGADQPKVIYVSTKMPFISTVKRVRKLLSLIEKRSMGKVDLIDGKGGDKEKLKALDAEGASKSDPGKGLEEVVLKATNRAIKTALYLALFFQKQDDLRVRFRTGTVSVVDDIVKVGKTTGEAELEDQEEETRLRKMCMLEVAITLK